jgi:predicted metal-dependent hydrolase
LSELAIETSTFSYSVHFSAKRRSVALQIKQGKLSVRAPLGYCLMDVEALVQHKHSWIIRHLQRSQQLSPPDWLTQQQLPYLGDMIQLAVHRGVKSSVSFDGTVLAVTLANRITDARKQTRVLELVRQWYTERALHWFTQRTGFWQSQMNVEPGNIIIGNWKTKWGYCKHTSELGFNWRLMMAPCWIADYVLVHELAHLKYLDHSRAFWQLVQSHYPQAAQAKAWLKQNQSQLNV